MKRFTIEVCTDSVLGCIEAQRAGAGRIELCDALSVGGTTPSYGMIRKAREATDIKLHLLIRPRGGDFLYNRLELEVMSEDVEVVRNLGVDGVVVGGLTPDGDIDRYLVKRLKQKAGDMSVTFHRAFDMCRDPFAALEELIDLGVDRILTSGQCSSAFKGAELLGRLVEKAADRLVIMPGGGINAENITAIYRATGASEFHLSARSIVLGGMLYQNPAVSLHGTQCEDDYSNSVTDGAKLRRVVALLGQME